MTNPTTEIPRYAVNRRTPCRSPPSLTMYLLAFATFCSTGSDTSCGEDRPGPGCMPPELFIARAAPSTSSGLPKSRRGSSGARNSMMSAICSHNQSDGSASHRCCWDACTFCLKSLQLLRLANFSALSKAYEETTKSFCSQTASCGPGTGPRPVQSSPGGSPSLDSLEYGTAAGQRAILLFIHEHLCGHWSPSAASAAIPCRNVPLVPDTSILLYWTRLTAWFRRMLAT